jgi:hypothetical protein
MIFAVFFPIAFLSMNLFPSFVASPNYAKRNKCAIVIFGLFIFLTELKRRASSLKASMWVGIMALGSNWVFSSAILASTFSIS